MTTEIVKAPKQEKSIVAGAQVRGLIPQNIDEAWRIANIISKSGMLPKGITTPEQAFVCVLAGAEVGLAPFQAVQNIASINGRPAIWGDAVVGLVRGSGKCDYIKETIEGDGDARVAICKAKRTDDESVTEVRFSVADARTAGLWGKVGPWSQYPSRMLQMRARGFALRDAFADVLKGIKTVEEMRDEVQHQGAENAIDVTPPEESSVLANLNSQIAQVVATPKPEPIIDTDTGEVIEQNAQAAESVLQEEKPVVPTFLKNRGQMPVAE